MPFFKVLLKRHLALLWSSQVLSAIGDYFYEIAVMWIAIKVAGSAGSIVAAAQSGAVLVFGLLGGVYADRWNRRTTMIIVNVIQALAVGTLPLLAMWGSLQLWYLILVAILVGSVGALFDPALQASLPALSGDTATLQATNGLMDVTRRLARAIGPSLAGALVAFLPLTQFFTLDSISFVISALAILLLGRNFAWKPELPERRIRKGIGGILAELAEALRLVRAHPALAWMLVEGGFVSGAWSIAFVVGAPLLADRVLHSNVGAYGFIVGAYGVGNVLSNLVVGSLTIKRRLMSRLLGWIVNGMGFLIMVSMPSLPIALLGSALAAIGGPMGDIPLMMIIQMDLPANQVGKVYSLRMTIAEAGNAIGLLLAAPLYAYLNVRLAIVCCSLVIIATGVLGFIRFGFVEPEVKTL